MLSTNTEPKFYIRQLKNQEIKNFHNWNKFLIQPEKL